MSDEVEGEAFNGEASLSEKKGTYRLRITPISVVAKKDNGALHEVSIHPTSILLPCFKPM